MLEEGFAMTHKDDIWSVDAGISFPLHPLKSRTTLIVDFFRIEDLHALSERAVAQITTKTTADLVKHTHSSNRLDVGIQNVLHHKIVSFDWFWWFRHWNAAWDLPRCGWSQSDVLSISRVEERNILSHSEVFRGLVQALVTLLGSGNFLSPCPKRILPTGQK